MLTGVVEAADLFSRLERLKSAPARRSAAEDLSILILANIGSISTVKLTIECGLADCKPDRSNSLPRDLAALMEAHGRLFKLLRQSGGDDNARAKCLIDLLQLELIWLGKMW